MMDNISPYFFPEQLVDGFPLAPPLLQPQIKMEAPDYLSSYASLNPLNALTNQNTPKSTNDMIQLTAIKSEPLDSIFFMNSTCTSQPGNMATSDYNVMSSNGVHPSEPKKKHKEKKPKVKQEKVTDHMTVRKKHDRFNGMPIVEVAKRTLPDHLKPDLDIVIVGINPGLFAAYVGHHYAGPGNHFWKCLFMAGLTPEEMTAYDDYKLLDFGIGFTNIVARTTRGSSDLTRQEIKEGACILIEKLRFFKPKIVAFNGKGIYEIFLGNKNFYIGKQPENLEGTDTSVFVMPSSSARCSQLPRAIDKVPFYTALKKLRDYLRGDVPTLDESEICFPDLELKVKVKEDPDKIKEEPNVNATDQRQQSSAPKKSRSSKKEPKSESGGSHQAPIPPLDFTPASQSAFTAVVSTSCDRNPTTRSSSFTSIRSEVKKEKPYDINEYGRMPVCSSMEPPAGLCMPNISLPTYLPNGYFSASASPGTCPPMHPFPPLPGFGPMIPPDHPSFIPPSYPPTTYPLSTVPCFNSMPAPGNFNPNPLFPLVKQEPVTFGYERHFNY